MTTTRKWIAAALAALALGGLLARQEARIAQLETEVHVMRNAAEGAVMLDAMLNRL